MYQPTTKVADGKERINVFELVIKECLWKIAHIQTEHDIMRSSSLCLCLLLVCIYQTAYSGRRLRPRILLEGDGINFPRRTLSKTQAANCVSSMILI